MKSLVVLSLAFILATGCSQRVNFKSALTTAETEFKDNMGFMLFDPESRKAIFEFNSGRYFTPASNTKVLTFYTALHMLGDSVPALKYLETPDSLLVWGTGDPSFLNKNIFDNRRTYTFLQQSPHRIFVSSLNFRTDHWGPGWAWDDYPFAFSTERSPFPMYGNLGHIQKQGDHFSIRPIQFQNHFTKGDTINGDAKIIREIDSNQITWFPGTRSAPDRTWDLPFHYSPDLLVELLSDTLKRQVDEIERIRPKGTKTLFSVPCDSVYSVMMKFSDNHIAEQLLLLCAENRSDTLNPEIAIRFATKNLFADLPDKLVWVDGSGLSRYNLTTPRNIVKVWEKLYLEIPHARLFNLLATNGKKGTLKNYNTTDSPFIFGKTGSLSNHLSLSGFLVTKKGKVLIFCFMNGNFIRPAGEVRAQMQGLLTIIRDRY